MLVLTKSTCGRVRSQEQAKNMVGSLIKKWEFWFGLVGVIGAIFAVYAYVATSKVGRISYVFDTQKVFDPTNLSGFSLVTADKTSVVAHGAVPVLSWNVLGREENPSTFQRPAAIRRPL